MKLDALDHPKTLDLASRLGVKRPTAIGHLELLWAWTGTKAPQGNLGKWPDGAIAEACYWEGDPKVFIQALIEAGLLDPHPRHRLLVHDWPHHAQSWVRMKLKKTRLDFITAEPIAMGSAEATTERTIIATTDAKVPIAEPIAMGSAEYLYARARSTPRHATPSEATPRHATPPGEGAHDPDRDPDNPEPWQRIVTRYPDGTYEQKSFLIGEREARRRVAEGFSWSELEAGVVRMAEQKSSQGKTGTQFVTSPAKFFAADPDIPGSFPFQGEFRLSRTKAQASQDSNIAEGLAFLTGEKS